MRSKLTFLFCVLLLMLTTVYAEDRNKMFRETRAQIIKELEADTSYKKFYEFTYNKYFDYDNVLSGTSKKYKSAVKDYKELRNEVKIESILYALKNGEEEVRERYATLYYKPKNKNEEKTIPNHIEFKYLEDEKKWVIEGVNFIYD